MSLLGSIQTHLGRIELHSINGGFETRGWYRDVITGELRESVVPVFADNAREWFDLCSERGAIHTDFPDPILERTAP